MQIAVTIIHNKSDVENFNQIELVKQFIEEVRESYIDENGEQHNILLGYKVKGLTLDHIVRFFQIVPFGVTPPSNLYDIDSHKVFYGKGDEDKIGSHPRFFNWGLKRGTDYGADISIYLDNILQFNTRGAVQALQKLTGDTELVETTFGKIASKRLLQMVGQLKEDTNLDQALIYLKQKVIQKGLKNG